MPPEGQFGTIQNPKNEVYQMFKRAILRLAWWVIRKYDPSRYEHYSNAIREDLRALITDVDPEDTPLYRSLKKKADHSSEWITKKTLPRL